MPIGMPTVTNGLCDELLDRTLLAAHAATIGSGWRCVIVMQGWANQGIVCSLLPVVGWLRRRTRCLSRDGGLSLSHEGSPKARKRHCRLETRIQVSIQMTRGYPYHESFRSYGFESLTNSRRFQAVNFQIGSMLELYN